LPSATGKFMLAILRWSIS